MIESGADHVFDRPIGSKTWSAPTLFLSDLHLSPDRPKAVAAFHAFTRGPARAAAAVYILGDLFDWWVGDDQLREPFIAPIAESLRALSDAGIPVFVARGNRDFMRAIREACGMRIGIPGPKPLLEIAAFLHRTETELLLKSRYVVPARLCRGGFPFQFPEWQFAARDLCHDGGGEY